MDMLYRLASRVAPGDPTASGTGLIKIFLTYNFPP